MNQFATFFTIAVLSMVFWNQLTAKESKPDPIREDLKNAIADYEEEMTEYQERAKSFFDQEEQSARRQGDKNLLDSINAARKVFKETNDLPLTAPEKIRSLPIESLTDLSEAYLDAIKRYIQKNQDDLAEAAEIEIAVLTRKAGYPWIAGVWYEGPLKNRIKVNIRQLADKFTATCVYQHATQGDVRWEMAGTLRKEGSFVGKLVHTKPRFFKSQTRTGRFGQNEDFIRGSAEINGGGEHEFTWSRINQ